MKKHHSDRHGRQCSFVLAALALTACASGPAIAQLEEADHQEPSRPTQSTEHNISPALYDLRGAWADAAILPLTLRHMDDIFLSRTVAHSGTPWEIPRNDHALNFTYEADGETYQAEEVLDRTYTNALLIIKDGRIVYETYRNGSDETDRFAGFSMTKSITSIMIGCAVEEGRLNINKPVDDYLPELKGGGYEGVTVKQILQMRSGADRNEDYSNLRNTDVIKPGSPTASMRDNIDRYADAALTVERSWEPGSHFNYLNLDTAVLGWVIERVTQRSIASYTTQCLWEPLGAEADGYFFMDGEPGVGREFNVAGYNATLRDWARIGLMMLNKGVAKNRVISEAWVAESTASVSTEQNDGWGYGYQWWTVEGSEAYSARGKYGQYVYVDPTTNTVIAKMSHIPVAANSSGVRQEMDAFFKAASAWTPE